MMLTGDKCMNLKILWELKDVDLVNFSQVNKEAYDLYKDPNIWVHKIITNFPDIPMNVCLEHKKGKTWKNYYTKELMALRKISQKPTLRAHYRTLLGIAIRKSLNDTIVLINVATDFDARCPAFYIACKNGYIDVVKYVVDSGVRISCCNDALLVARSADHWEILKYIASLGANINARVMERFRSFDDSKRVAEPYRRLKSFLSDDQGLIKRRRIE